VECCGEQGLLGLAFHPDFARNGRYFVYYTQLDARQAVVEFPADRPLLVMDDQAGNHNGGAIAFGRDGKLYIATGDGGGGGDPQESGQDPQSLLGKILRIDVDRGDPYEPAGTYPGGAPEVWDIGLRNPWRISFDACTGDLYIGDVGQGTWEEIDVEPAGEGGKNYGWDRNEGNHCYYDSGDPMPCPMTFTPPVAEYDHSQGTSITGGYVYRGAAIPSLRGRYLYGDYGSPRIWSFLWSGGQAVDPVELSSDLETATTVRGIASFGQDGAGEVYVVSRDSGQLFKIVAE
jgi:glucose/arabinose dehydrogenase